jgi:purine-binding chemotaxis protein CheW
MTSTEPTSTEHPSTEHPSTEHTEHPDQHLAQAAGQPAPTAPTGPAAGPGAGLTRQLATFTVGPLLFGVDVSQVQEVIRYQEMTTVPLAAAGAAGLINLRGEVVTAIDLRTRLGLPARPADQLPMNVVIRVNDEPVSLLVDTIGDVAQVHTDQYEPPPDTMTGPGHTLILGAYKLHNQLLLALDVTRATDLGPSAGAA